jgi:hypothetical protein
MKGSSVKELPIAILADVRLNPQHEGAYFVPNSAARNARNVGTVAARIFSRAMTWTFSILKEERNRNAGYYSREHASRTIKKLVPAGGIEPTA